MTTKPKSVDEIQWDNISMTHILRKIEGERRRMVYMFDFMEYAVKHMHAKSNGVEHDRDLIDGYIREWDRERYENRNQPLSALLSIYDSPLWKEKLFELNSLLHGKPLTQPQFQRRVRHYLENLSAPLTQPEVGQEQLKEDD